MELGEPCLGAPALRVSLEGFLGEVILSCVFRGGVNNDEMDVETTWVKSCMRACRGHGRTWEESSGSRLWERLPNSSAMVPCAVCNSRSSNWSPQGTQLGGSCCL